MRIEGGTFGAVVQIALGAAAFLAWRFSGLEPVWLIVALFALNAVLKLAWPRHIVLAHVSWLYLCATFVLLLGGAILLNDGSILGLWTAPAVIGLGLLFCIVHVAWGPRFGDDGTDASR